MSAPDLHRLGELRSLAYHAEVSRRLETDAGLLEAARQRATSWLSTGAVSRPYAEEWARLLRLPLPELVAALADAGERMTTLRSCSPFAGALDPRTRWRIFREARQSAERTA